ncbi:hypothetical protein EMGBS15_12740 [Filimonas sp.]|nr:hypothetical protein EMGBS15_12740 [Filimonas sp.]
MEILINKVAESGIITLNLEELLPKEVLVFDLKSFLFMELILKEKDYRAALQTHDWTQYQHKDVILTCSVDAIIPVWAYMLAAQYLQPVAARIRMGTIEQATKELLLDTIDKLDIAQYNDQRMVIKGCGDVPIPDEAYAMITAKLKPVVKSIMYGEPCSTVPIYKRKSV